MTDEMCILKVKGKLVFVEMEEYTRTASNVK